MVRLAAGGRNDAPQPTPSRQGSLAEKKDSPGRCCYLPANVDSRVRPPLMKSLLHRIRAVWHSRPILLKMFSFGVIGLGNTVIDFGVFTFAYKVLELPLVASNVLAWLVAVSGSYVMNTMIAFRAESGRMLRRKD